MPEPATQTAGKPQWTGKRPASGAQNPAVLQL